ncbi:MAG TPA: glycosyltransferase family 2 protein [Candidatus Polarisedimenticolia bacterium]|nr:glycosyltransferase family 2 protein [Candidatus Polarisedimenticolia bacterium]
MTSTIDPRERRGAEGRPQGDIGTPASWRLIALGVLVAGLVAGWLVATSAAGPAVALAIALVAFVVAAAAAFAGRRPPIAGLLATAATGRLPTLSVLIPVRDEANVIGRLVEDLANQDHRTSEGPAFEVIVVDDRSTDGTGTAAEAAAEEAGAASFIRVARRAGAELSDGKGAALTLVQPEACRGEGIVVLDGDARVGPTFLRTLAGYLAAGAVAVTPRRQTNTHDATWLTSAQAVEQAQDGALQRGRWAFGGCSELRGNGMTVRRNALAAVGGWRAEELTEDLDLSSRLAARLGVTVAWAIDAVVVEEPVRRVGSLWRQRLRWAEGSIRRVFEHGVEVLASPLLPIRAKLDFAGYVGQLVAAPLILGTLAAAARTGLVLASATFIGGYIAASGLLAWVGLGREAAVDGAALTAARRFGSAILAAAFSVLWLAAIPGAFVRLALRRGPLTFAKTVHGGVPPEAEPVAERG